MDILETNIKYVIELVQTLKPNRNVSKYSVKNLTFYKNIKNRFFIIIQTAKK
jgi:hypothetical protein